MSKEHKFNEKIIDALSNISIKFDELGFVSTTLNDKNYEYFVDWFKDEVKMIKDESSKQEKTIADLEAKLAESEDKNKKLKDEVHKSNVGIAHLKNQLKQVKEKITEKEKEYQSFKKIADENVNYLKNRILEETRNYNQDKISFTVEKLEKVKELCREKFKWWENSEWEGDIYDKTDVSNAYFDIEANIEEQIKQLKEGK